MAADTRIKLALDSNVYSQSYIKNAVPENIHTHPKDGHWNSEGEGDSIAKTFKRKNKAKLEFPWGWEGSNQKTILGGGMDISWNHTLLVVD